MSHKSCNYMSGIDMLHYNNNKYILTNTQEVPTHSAAPSKCIHSSNPKSHKKETGRDRQDITGIQTAQARTLQQPMLICGHTHASPEPRPTKLRKHTQTCTVHEKGPSTQPNAKLAQSACNEVCPIDPPGLAASSPSACRSFIASWPKRP
jgi:hypothetical protein